jgi:putative oxidoreductase
MTTQTATPPTPSTPSVVPFIDGLSSLAFPVVRVTTGLLLIPHGAQKLFGWFGGFGVTATGQYFESTLGMSPGIVFATLAGLIEVFGGLALTLGLFTRPAALAVAVFMGVALSVHVPNGFFWTAGGIEYPLMWTLLAVAIFLRGGDRYSLDTHFGLRI